MAGTVNKHIIIGHLGHPPEVRVTPGGTTICKLSVATESRMGENKTVAQWHRVTVFGKMAEACGKYLDKGSKVYVEGEVRYQTVEKDGVKRTFTETVAQSVTFLSSPKRGDDAVPPNDPGEVDEITLDDVPF